MSVSAPERSPKLEEGTRREAAAAWLRAAKWNVASMRGVRAIPAVAGEEDAPNPPRRGMRLFVKGCPLHFMSDIILLLSEEGPVTDPIADGVVIPGVWYPRPAIWNRDGATSDNGDNTKTLIRDFGDGPLSYQIDVEDGCGSRTAVRYVFDAVSVEALPADLEPCSSGQGITTRIGGVSRDINTGYFNYFVTVTERKTVYMGENQCDSPSRGVLTSEDAFFEEFAADWLGLRGSPSAPVNDAGEYVPVWTPVSISMGTSANVQWSRSPEDCTLSAQGRKRVAKRNVVAGVSCSKDLFSEQDTESISGVTTPLEHAPEPADGVSYEYQSKLRGDRLRDNSKAKKTERPVAEAQVSVEEDLYSRVETRDDRSQRVDPEAASVGGGLIVSPSTAKTPGNLKNNHVVKRREKPVSRARVAKSEDLFGYEESVTDRGQPSEAAPPTPGAGISGSSTTERSPGDLKNNTVSFKREKAVVDARKAVSDDVFTRKEQSVDENMPTGTPSATVANGVIEEVSCDKTPGGNKRVTRTRTEEHSVPDVALAESADAFHRTAEQESVGVDGSAAAPPAAGGVTQAVSRQRTPGGKYRKRISTNREITVMGAEVVTSKTPFGVQVRRLDKSVLASIALGAGEYGTVINSVTPGNLFNTVKDSITPTLGARYTHEKGGDYFSTFERYTEVAPSTAVFGAVGLVGKTITTESISRDDNNHVRRTLMVETAGPERVLELFTKFSFTPAVGGVVRLGSIAWSRLFMNANWATVVAAATLYVADGDFEMGFGLHINKFGLWDGTLSFKVTLYDNVQLWGASV